MAGDAPPTTSLTDTAEHWTRARIVDGTFPAGHRLRERELSEALGISRVPVREALHNLAHQGFVVLQPRRGATVVSMDAVAVDELFDLRCLLEPFAARAAADAYGSGRSHPGLDNAMTQAENALDSGDPEEILIANAVFHEQLLEAARHSFLLETSQPVIQKTRWIFAQTADRSADGQLHEHHVIYDAIRTGQAQLAEACMLAHVESGRRASLAAVTPDPTTTEEK